jgi:hypothetical protein
MKVNKMYKFWVVMRDKPESYISKRHPTMEAAEQEAERLCRKEQVAFYILQVIEAVEPVKSPLKWTTSGLEPYPPF